MKQKLRNLAALLVVVLVLGCWVGAAGGATIQQRVFYLNDKIDDLSVTGVYSDNEVYSTWIDLTQISGSGSVTTSTYKDGVILPVTGNFTTTPRDFNYAVDKITRYVLGNIANTYRQEPFNTEITMITYQRTTIPVYVYGDYKSDAIDEILGGLPNCFNISYNTSSGFSTPTTPLPMPVIEKIMAKFTLNNTTYSTSDGTVQAMDVAPYVKDNRTYTPVRYLAYALGVPEEGIQWDEATQTVTITKGDTTLKLTIGSKVLTKNKETIIMDVAPELVNPGRTMLPARWVSEALGATVTWDEAAQQVTIEILQKQG